MVGLAVKRTRVPWQTLREEAVIETPTVSRGNAVIRNDGDRVPLLQLSDPYTVISPDINVGEKFRVMEFVFAPPIAVMPAGRFQV